MNQLAVPDVTDRLQVKKSGLSHKEPRKQGGTTQRVKSFHGNEGRGKGKCLSLSQCHKMGQCIISKHQARRRIIVRETLDRRECLVEERGRAYCRTRPIPMWMSSSSSDSLALASAIMLTNAGSKKCAPDTMAVSIGWMLCWNEVAPSVQLCCTIRWTVSLNEFTSSVTNVVSIERVRSNAAALSITPARGTRYLFALSSHMRLMSRASCYFRMTPVSMLQNRRSSSSRGIPHRSEKRMNCRSIER